jgi:hypothetical protein
VKRTNSGSWMAMAAISPPPVHYTPQEPDRSGGPTDQQFGTNRLPVDKKTVSGSHTTIVNNLALMKIIAALLLSALTMATGVAAEKESRFFEMRTYYAAPGKLEDLEARFRNHTMGLFEKHDMVNIGYWVPLTNTENKLIYLLAYPSREARERAWKEFSADPAWQAVVKESERNGKLVSKAVSVFLKPTDFSPVVRPESSSAPRVFELRTYHAAPGKLDELLARFRDHTTALFTKHGMAQFGYWLHTEKKDGAGEVLVYILAHRSTEAAEASFKAFRADSDWIKAKAASEVNGSLTVKDGVQSVFMVPTDFSPAK